MIVEFVALATQALPAAVPAPPAAPPIPITTVRTPDAAQRRMGEIYAVDIDARANGQAIWQGELRVNSAGGGSSFRQEASEPLSLDCARASYIGQTILQRFRVELRPVYAGGVSEGAYPTNVTISWGRAASGCSGTRSVELNQLVDLEPGKTVSVSGDGGLVVRLTRRPSR